MRASEAGPARSAAHSEENRRRAQPRLGAAPPWAAAQLRKGGGGCVCAGRGPDRGPERVAEPRKQV